MILLLVSLFNGIIFQGKDEGEREKVKIYYF